MIRLRAATLARAALGVAMAIVALFAYRQFVATRDTPNPGASAPSPAAHGMPAIRRVEPPRPVPDLRFVDGAARPRTFAGFRGRVVLLNIWATWCVPCREEMPALDRLQAQLGAPAFDVLALSIDRDGLAKVQAFYDELGLKELRIYVDTDSDTMARLGVMGIPLTLLVDRQGNERWRVIGPAQWDRRDIVDMIRKEIDAPAK